MRLQLEPFLAGPGFDPAHLKGQQESDRANDRQKADDGRHDDLRRADNIALDACAPGPPSCARIQASATLRTGFTARNFFAHITQQFLFLQTR